MDQANAAIVELQSQVKSMESKNTSTADADVIRDERRAKQKTKRELEEALALIEEQEDELAKKNVKIDSLEMKVTDQGKIIKELKDSLQEKTVDKKNNDDNDVPERQHFEEQLAEKDLTLKTMERSLEAKKIEVEVLNQQLVTFQNENTTSGSDSSSAGSFKSYSIADDRRQSVRSDITDGHDESESEGSSGDDLSESSSSSSITTAETKVSRRIYDKLKNEMVDALRLIDEQEVYLTEKEGTIVRMEMKLEKALASSTSSSPKADSEALQRVKDDLEVAKVRKYSLQLPSIIVSILGSSSNISVFFFNLLNTGTY